MMTKAEPAMAPAVLRVFLSEIEQQCDFALQADGRLTASLLPDASDTPWLHLRTIVIAAANVSKLLWNSREKIPGRCRTLRDISEVDDGSPLSSRELRNIFEHYDERIEKWAAKSKRLNIAQDCIGSPRVMFRGLDECDYHRIYDPTTGTFWFWGTEYPLRPIIDELRKIKEALAVPQQSR